MPLRYRNGRPLYGKTLQTVLAKRPLPRDRRRPAGRDSRRIAPEPGRLSGIPAA